jgi:rhodanese-related sulfurtransferase
MPSIQAAVAAKKAGYTNIFILTGGLPEWHSKGYPIER